jgi:uncharacterized protein
MSVQENVQIVKEAYAAFGRGDMQGLLALLAEDIEWISPGGASPPAGTYRGLTAVAGFFRKLSEVVNTESRLRTALWRLRRTARARHRSL